MADGKNSRQMIKIAVTGMGTAAGPVFRITKNKEADRRQKLTSAEEWNNYTEAVRTAGEKLRTSGSGDMQDVMSSYVLFLEDSDSMDMARREIFEHGLSACEAAEKAGRRSADKLANLEDSYLRSRSDDVIAAYEYLIRELNGDMQNRPSQPSILVGDALMPTDISGMDPSDILAVITGKGSQTSHLAIISRGMGIPYISCADDAVMNLKTGECMIADTDKGELVIHPGSEEYSEAGRKMEERILQNRETENISSDIKLPIKLYANIGKPEDMEAVQKYGAEGIGLFRSEFLFLNRDKAPDEEEQFQAYRTVVEGMEGKPVIIRTSDIGTDKLPAYMDLPHEENPALGRRAIRISLSSPEEYRVQLRALLRAACYGNEKIMYPMITSVKELKELRQQLELAVEELEARKENYRIPPCGIMIETPAAAMISDILAQEVDFFSVGTNDLTQYTLALDRQGEGLDMFYDPHHEGILRLIELSARNAHAAGIEIGICGELGSDPALADRFIDAGIDELSMSAASIPKVRKVLADILRKPAEKSPAPAKPDEAGFSLAAPADGRLVPMREIPDPVFSSGTLGDCFAVKPDNGKIYAPCSGEIVSIAETKHAFTIRTESGTEVLVHAGIDTVKLGGKGFHVFVKEGGKVSCGECVMKADLDVIQKEGYETMIVTVLL